MEITKREIIVSIAIISIMLTIGLFISSAINNNYLDKTQIYNTAISVVSTEMFEYGMKTNVGNAFVNGHLYVVDPVSFDEIDGEYWYVKKVIEEYREHTRTVSYTDSEGIVHTRIETYWSWDEIKSEKRYCTTINFLGVQFPESKISIPSVNYICTIEAGYHKRYVFYGTSTDHEGTIFTKLYDGSISDHNELYENKTIDEAKKDLTDFNWCVLFWFGWIILTCVIIYIFYYIDNEWLE